MKRYHEKYSLLVTKINAGDVGNGGHWRGAKERRMKKHCSKKHSLNFYFLSWKERKKKKRLALSSLARASLCLVLSSFDLAVTFSASSRGALVLARRDERVRREVRWFPLRRKTIQISRRGLFSTSQRRALRHLFAYSDRLFEF